MPRVVALWTMNDIKAEFSYIRNVESAYHPTIRVNALIQQLIEQLTRRCLF